MRFIYTRTFAVVFASLVVVCIFAIMHIKGWLDPVRRFFLYAPRPVAFVARGVAMPVKDFFSSAYRLRDIVRENGELRGQVSALQGELASLQQEKRENEALRKELGFASQSPYRLVACAVLSKNAFGLTDALILDCGQDKGVVLGQAVLSQGFLVGKVAHAGKNNSTVLLAVSSRFSADAELSKTGADGIVSGSYGAGLIFDRLSQNEEVQPGWYAVTAGINQQIPKGLLIGQVGDLVSSGNELFKRTTLLSPVDFNKLDFVFVVAP